MANVVELGETGSSNLVAGNGTNVATFPMPAGAPLVVESVVATINNSAGGDLSATLTIKDQSGEVIAEKRQNELIPAGASGTATWSLRDDDNGGTGTAGGFIKFDFDNEGGYLDVTTNDQDANGRGIALKDNSGGELLLQNYGGGKINLDSHRALEGYGLTDLLLQSGASASVRAQNGDLFLIANGVGKNVQVRMDTGNSFFVLDFATAALYFGSGSWGTTAYLATSASFKVVNHLLATLFEVTEAGAITFPGGGTVVPTSPSDATKFLNGAATPAFALVKDSDLSTSDITTNNATTAKHGFAPKYPNDATKYLDGTGAYSTPAGTGAGIGAVLFDSTLGADTASIDTGAGGIAAGYHFILVLMVLRTDDAGATAAAQVTLNNDTGAKYDIQAFTGNNATVSAATVLAGANWSFTVHGSGGTAGYASDLRLEFPAYDQTTFFKTGTAQLETIDGTAGNNRSQANGLGFRDTVAISRLKVAAVGAAKLKAGSRLTVIGW